MLELHRIVSCPEQTAELVNTRVIVCRKQKRNAPSAAHSLKPFLSAKSSMQL